MYVYKMATSFGAHIEERQKLDISSFVLGRTLKGLSTAGHLDDQRVLSWIRLLTSTASGKPAQSREVSEPLPSSVTGPVHWWSRRTNRSLPLASLSPA